MKEKIVTEQNIARFEKELKKSEKTPNTIHKYVRDVRKLQTYADGRGLTRDLMIAYRVVIKRTASTHFSQRSIGSASL